MKLNHHDLEIDLDDDWWAEAGMSGFVPTTKTYRVDSSMCGDREVFEIPIEEFGPVRRAPGIRIFNDNEEATAGERVVSILVGFRSGTAIPPVEMVRQPESAGFRYKLVAGVHRFYCSLAAGFSHVPAVKGFDRSALDR